MAKFALTTTPVKVARASQQPTLFNQGPGTVWLAYDPDEADSVDGFPLAAETGYEFPRDLERDLFASAGTTADLRVLVVG